MEKCGKHNRPPMSGWFCKEESMRILKQYKRQSVLNTRIKIKAKPWWNIWALSRKHIYEFSSLKYVPLVNPNDLNNNNKTITKNNSTGGGGREWVLESGFEHET